MRRRVNSYFVAVITTLALLLGGCGGGGSNTPPATFENAALRFSYPAAWTLEEHDFSAGISMIAVESAFNGGMIVQYFPADMPMSLDQYAQDFAVAFGESVPVFDVSLESASEIIGDFGGVSLAGRRQEVSLGLFGFETAYRLDFYHHKIGDDRVFLIFHYSEDSSLGSGDIDVVRESFEFL